VQLFNVKLEISVILMIMENHFALLIVQLFDVRPELHVRLIPKEIQSAWTVAQLLHVQRERNALLLPKEMLHASHPGDLTKMVFAQMDLVLLTVSPNLAKFPDVTCQVLCVPMTTVVDAKLFGTPKAEGSYQEQSARTQPRLVCNKQLFVKNTQLFL